LAVFVHSKGDRGESVEETGVDGHEKLEQITCMEQFRQIAALYGLPCPKLDLLPIGVEPLAGEDISC
ncbi:hypothetical protein COOONC_01183, partial [Cooperia oncophora]